MKEIFRKTLLGTLILLAIAYGSIFFLENEKDYIKSVDKNSYLRLHILANSNNLYDQELKLEVRNAILDYINPIFKDCTDAQSAKLIAEEKKTEILKIAQETIIARGYNYPVDIEIAKSDFPVKTYGNLTLPAGEYQAVRVLIGEAKGENWWCVLFPPICLINGTISSNAAENKEENTTPQIRWKILELINK
ncbi:stage II sporulation protein R [Selenomonadales bacterium OttesenSCG-928-I06]|nr:stage II sporulation protein R [Selenomonadales bacterium OttesenSCG-928-I06]